MAKTPSNRISDFPEDTSAGKGGLRMTRQRQEVYRLLLEQRDHPTAQDVFLRVKDRLPNIPLATVYSTLEALVQHGLVRQVNCAREPSRFCPNRAAHGHFHDNRSGTIHDGPFEPGVNRTDVLELPPGTVITDV